MADGQTVSPPEPRGSRAPGAPQPLDDHLCFALYAASRAVTGLYRPLLDRLGLTYPQFLVMLALWERESASVKELSEALQLDYGTLTPLLKRMVAADLIRKERQTDDERMVLVTLTEHGRTLDAQTGCIDEAVAASIGLSPKQYATLRDTLHAVAASAASGRLAPVGGHLGSRPSAESAPSGTS